MFRSAIGHLSDIYVTKSDAQQGRNHLRALTTKLLELQQLLFKARTRLISEGTHARRWKTPRQLQLTHMTHHTPNLRPPNRPWPTTFLATVASTTPWLKKTTRHSTPDSSTTFPRPTHQHHRPRLRHTPTHPPTTITIPTLTFLTPQPPLLTTPH